MLAPETNVLLWNFVHMKVWLVYEDDYGGMFSPYFLTQVFTDEEAAKSYSAAAYLDTIIRESEYAGTLDLSAYPKSIGGLFSDDY